LKTTITKKGWGRVAQGVGPEFKPTHIHTQNWNIVILY
jgi:hypothetical protein